MHARTNVLKKDYFYVALQSIFIEFGLKIESHNQKINKYKRNIYFRQKYTNNIKHNLRYTHTLMTVLLRRITNNI
jgi:hypothetical protein